MPAPASSTSVGSGTRSPSKLSSPAPRSGGAGGSNLKQRKTTSSSTTAPRSRAAGGAGTGGMWRFYTDDSPGIKVGPVPVLVMSLLFIASVFMLHIWGKYNRS
ncbi:sec61 translocon subunit beta [Haematobia irritans]|uniref:Putative sec61 protein translocation complex beta subunit n=1 Tax=Haematobia irritans TaxID=7368 RepID=A0A1L8EHQ4_HAEIR